jgi:hypothetical protein
MTSRRSFFSSLCGIAAATTAVAVPPTPKQPPDQFERNGWKYSWSGWIPSCSSSFFSGHWVAHRSAPKYQRDGFYSTDSAVAVTGGVVTWFSRGDEFDISIWDGHRIIDTKSTEEDRRIEKDSALSALIKFLDAKG